MQYHQAPDDADFIAVKHPGNGNRVVYQCVGPNPEDRVQVASCSAEGFSIFVAGVSARRASLFDCVTGEFLCGTLGQLNPIKEA